MDHYKNFVKVVIALNVFLIIIIINSSDLLLKKLNTIFYYLFNQQIPSCVLRCAGISIGLSYLSVVLQVILCAILVGNYPKKALNVDLVLEQH